HQPDRARADPRLVPAHVRAGDLDRQPRELLLQVRPARGHRRLQRRGLRPRPGARPLHPPGRAGDRPPRRRPPVVVPSIDARRPIRGTGMDIDAARLTGVKVGRIYAWTYAIGAALAGAAGSLLSVIVPFDPNLGGTYTKLAFVICVLGGLGALANVVLGATLVAFVEVFVG